MGSLHPYFDCVITDPEHLILIQETRTELAVSVAEAWKLAGDNIERAQETQKKKYDSGRPEIDLKVGERVMVYMLSDTQGPDRKLA